MNTAKKKYESLLILHNRLCNVLNEVDYLKIIDLLKEDIQLVKQYHLFPIELSDKFYTFGGLLSAPWGWGYA